VQDPLEHFRWLYDVSDYTNREAVAKRWDEDVVINQSRDFPSTHGTYRGREGLFGLVRELDASYADQSWVPLEVRELGDDRYAVLLDVRGTGRRTGIPMELRIGHLVTLKDDRIARIDSFLTWQDALDAAGLEASAES
jgi:ketosteroid isomerase-like protein